MKHTFAATGLSLVVLLAVGCGAADAISNSIDCHHVCQRYADCYNSGYDVGACTNRCESRANASGSNMDDLQTCDNCIGDKSCVSATFTCTSECSTIPF